MTATQSEVETTLDILEAVAPFEDTDDGQDHKTHIVNPPLNTHIWEIGMTSKEIVEIARMTGQYVIALCGYKWIPKRNPENYDTCQSCMQIAQLLITANGS